MDAIYRVDDVDDLLSPSLLVFRERLTSNLEEMIAIAGGVERLRPHCKTHKLREVVRMELDRGIARHKAATIAEAEMLAESGCRDIVLSYNLVGPNIRRAVEFVNRFPAVSFAALADDERNVADVGAAMHSAGRSIGLLVDLNPGRDRTGRPAGEAAFRLYQQIASTPGLHPAGLHLYDGQQHQRDFEERSRAVAAAWQPIEALALRITRAGLPLPRIICGGTPTFPVYARMQHPALELSPGTCLFHDAGYGDKFPDLARFTPAALVLTRVISRPTENRITFDCGTKSVASDPPMGERLVLPDIPRAVQVLHNEEHLVVETPDASRWRVGDWTLAIPRHICPTTALHRSVYVIQNGSCQGEWDVVARDRRLTI